MHCMFLATDIPASTLAFNHKSSTTKTMRMMRTQKYLGYTSLLINKRLVLVYEIGLKYKGMTDLWCTSNKNTIGTLECWSEA